MAQKLSTTVRNFSTLARDEKILAASVSIAMLRYFTVYEGTRSDFFSFITIPRVLQSKRRDWTACLASRSKEARINQSSRYWRNLIP